MVAVGPMKFWHRFNLWTGAVDRLTGGTEQIASTFGLSLAQWYTFYYNDSNFTLVLVTTLYY